MRESSRAPLLLLGIAFALVLLLALESADGGFDWAGLLIPVVAVVGFVSVLAGVVMARLLVGRRRLRALAVDAALEPTPVGPEHEPLRELSSELASHGFEPGFVGRAFDGSPLIVTAHADGRLALVARVGRGRHRRTIVELRTCLVPEERWVTTARAPMGTARGPILVDALEGEPTVDQLVAAHDEVRAALVEAGIRLVPTRPDGVVADVRAVLRAQAAVPLSVRVEAVPPHRLRDQVGLGEALAELRDRQRQPATGTA